VKSKCVRRTGSRDTTLDDCSNSRDYNEVMPYSYFFRDDYSEGAHPKILEALSRTNLQQESSYGADAFTCEAERLIKIKINKPQAKVYFVAGGTLANLVSLSAILKPYESVIVAETGHPNVRECGAIEATGHKLNIVPDVDGRLTPDTIQQVVAVHTDDHMVVPKAVYISQATECGTIYSKQQIHELSAKCKQNKLYFYIDGARVGNAIMAEGADCDLAAIADLCDMFFIGGTKNGALLGEAIVIVNPDLQEHFRYSLKQRGALLAKTRAVSVQFMELFENNLYFENAKHANQMAQSLAKGVAEYGYRFLNASLTNQIFPVLPNPIIEKLQQKYCFYVWVKNYPAASDLPSNSSVIRLVTSWATPQSAVTEFLSELKKAKNTCD
jgi:threonine aldolase